MPNIPISISSTALDTPMTAARLVNCYAEQAPAGAKRPVYLRGVPGATLWKDLAPDGASGQIRAAKVWNGNLYVVVGSNVFEVTPAGAATNIGSVPGPERVTIATTILHIAFASGATNYWYYDGTTFSASTNPGFPAGNFQSFDWVVSMNQRFIFGDKSTGYFVWTDPAIPNTTLAGNIRNAEGLPDNLLGGSAHQRQLTLYGGKSIEVYADSGASSGDPWVVLGSGAIERGIAAPATISYEDSTDFWLGEDRIAYRMNGRTPLRISGHDQEHQWEELEAVDDAFAFFHTWKGHKFWCLTFPTDLVTWLYDLNTGTWHERQTWQLGRWRANAFEEFNGLKLIGDFATPVLYQLDDSVGTDAGAFLGWEVHLDTIFDPDNHFKVFHGGFWAKFEAGVGGITEDQASEVMLDWADDGKPFGTEMTRSIGADGQTELVPKWWRLGCANERVYRLRGTDPYKMRLHGVYADLALGSGP
ncbi:MAG: hypothetical protein AAFN78_01025 [Pseudomonadota bacterium]